jgi:[ribosomal protein S5]-alanine N-acetyltransferase
VRTERLVLRQWRASDLGAYAEIVGDPEVSRYLGDGAPFDRNGAWRQMAIFIGHLTLRGYATEAGRVAVQVAWESLRPDRVVSLVRPGNEASVRVARKLGGFLDEQIDFMGGRALVFAYPQPGA